MAVITACMPISSCKKEEGIQTQIADEKLDGMLLVRVVDSSSKEPIDDAEIVVMDVDSIYKTNDIGFSPEIALEVNKSMYKRYGDELYEKVPSGCANVLITKEGYKDYLVLNKAIYPGSGPNFLQVEMIKHSEGDSKDYLVEQEGPHEVWIGELIDHCSKLAEGNTGDGDTEVTVNVLDGKSAPIEGAQVVIPELNIKATTDKAGKCVLNPVIIDNEGNVAQEEMLESGEGVFTLVVIKEDFTPFVLFNVAMKNIIDNRIQVTLNQKTGEGEGDCVVSHYPLEEEWVEKVITSFKEGTE